MNSAEFNNWLKVELLLVRASECLGTMFEQCWKRKYNVEWDNTPACGQSFTTTVGSSVYKIAGKIQKDLLENGDTRKWDLSIFNSIFTKTDLNKDTTFHAKLKTLVSIRNRIAHLSDKKVTDQLYQQFWTDLKDILLFLGVTDDELDDILHSHSSGSKLYVLGKNVQKAVELKQEGNNLLKEDKFQDAVDKYTDAIVLPGIPDQDLSILHSNRSFCYLKLGKYAEALEDAKMSKNLNPDYTKAYIRLGKAYMALEKYDKAIKNFDKALGLDTNNEEIQQMRSEARRLKGLKERDNDESLDAMNVRMQDRLNDFGNLDEIKRMMIKQNPSLEHVWAGHEYRDNKDYSKAVECYRRAADMRNPEAIYNLALLMVDGKGVPKDYKQAFKLLKEAAHFDPFDKYNSPVVGVKEAEHSIALSYHEGTLTEKDCNMAVLWYERAISHRSGMSANNLALMYQNGDGVVKDLQKAEKLFLCAMNYGDPNAMDNLVGLYWESGNFNKAEKWNEKSMKLGSKIARHMEKPIAEMLLKINSDFHRLTDWEKEHNLPIENLTIKERLLRKISHEHPDKPEILKVLKDLQGIRNRSEKPSPTNLTKGYKYDLEVLAKRKDKSVFSNRMYFAVLRFFQAMDIFTNIEGRSTAVLDSDSRSFIRRLAECYKLEHFVGTMPMDIREKVCEQIVLLLAESDRVVQHCNNDDELAFNQDCRICYAVLNMQSDEIIDFLTECIKKYPNNTFFLEMRGSMYNFKEKRELALRDYIRVDELTKDDVDNTYHKAVTLKLMGRNVQAIETYKKFLSLASVDHRKVPEAYYAIGVCVFAKRRDSDMDPDSIAPYYIQGLEAEKEQIPFLLPYDSTSKELLELMLRMTKKLPVINAEVKEKPVVKPIDPLRKELIVDHRRGVKQFSKLKNSSGYKYNFTATPSETQSVPMSLVGLKPTYLNEIDPTSDRVLHGYVLELTLITAPFDNSMSISFVAEDSNSDVQRVSLYNFDKIHLLAIGAKISIINPYIRMAMDNKPLIRVDDPNSVIVSPHRVVDMCHFCGKSHSKYACSKCKKSKYCSKECQDLDWKEYSHKLICVS